MSETNGFAKKMIYIHDGLKPHLCKRLPEGNYPNAGAEHGLNLSTLEWGYQIWQGPPIHEDHKEELVFSIELQYIYITGFQYWITLNQLQLFCSVFFTVITKLGFWLGITVFDTSWKGLECELALASNSGNYHRHAPAQDPKREISTYIN